MYRDSADLRGQGCPGSTALEDGGAGHTRGAHSRPLPDCSSGAIVEGRWIRSGPRRRCQFGKAAVQGRKFRPCAAPEPRGTSHGHAPRIAALMEKRQLAPAMRAGDAGSTRHQRGGRPAIAWGEGRNFVALRGACRGCWSRFRHGTEWETEGMPAKAPGTSVFT